MDFDELRAALDLPSGGNEPPVPKLVAGDSFLFVRTVGSRVSPDVQLLELYREVFFRKPLGKSARALDIAAASTAEERAVFLLSRGRVRQGGNTGREFYAPVYPEQAQHGWLRSESDRAIRDHLFCGAVWQYLNDAYRGNDPANILLSFVRALDGTRRRTADGVPEILDLAISNAAPPEEEAFISDHPEAACRLLDQARHYPHIDLPSGLPDPLAARLTTDLAELSQMEPLLPRLQWLELLKTFIRFSTSSWVLAQMKILVLIHGWCRECLEGKVPPSLEEATHQIRTRNRSLFHPVNTGGDELEFHVQRYIRARTELSLMLRLAACLCKTPVDAKRLTVNSVGKECMTLEELFVEIADLRRAYAAKVKGVGPLQAVLRLAERYPGWASPRWEGQGKNLFEFFQVIVRLEGTREDSGYLVTRKKRPTAGGRDRIFPGPLLIRLVTALAARQRKAPNGGNGGKLLLSNLENHFAEYGVDFSSSAGARPLLLDELARLGLLKGSPDAGDSAEIYLPLDLLRAG